MTGGDMMVMSWSLVLGDPVYLAYFKEFLRLNEQRLITLHREIRKFRSAVPTTHSKEESGATAHLDDDYIREQLLYSALSNVSEITRDAVNVTKRTSEELNAEAQRVVRNYGDLFDLDSKIIGNFRRKVTKGIVGDDDLETIESHVEHLLDVKVAHFVRSKHYKALMVEIYTDKTLTLDKLLCYAPMHSAFKEFMQAEKSMDVLSFYLMASAFASDYDLLESHERSKRAEQLYLKLESLGFSEHVRQQIRLEMKKLKANSFELPQRQALTTLKTVYLPLFLRSKQYRAQLNKLINEAGLVKTEIEQKHRDTINNTDLSQFRPEAIYYRPLSGHLCLGHIDSLGRYRSEALGGDGVIGRILMSKEKKKYTLTLRGWSPVKDGHLAEEEAWRTARMFVADIISASNK